MGPDKHIFKIITAWLLRLCGQWLVNQKLAQYEIRCTVPMPRQLIWDGEIGADSSRLHIVAATCCVVSEWSNTGDGWLLVKGVVVKTHRCAKRGLLINLQLLHMKIGKTALARYIRDTSLVIKAREGVTTASLQLSPDSHLSPHGRNGTRSAVRSLGAVSGQYYWWYLGDYNMPDLIVLVRLDSWRWLSAAARNIHTMYLVWLVMLELSWF